MDDFRKQTDDLLAKINHALLSRIETNIVSRLQKPETAPDATDVRLLWTIIHRQATPNKEVKISGAEYVELQKNEQKIIALIPETPEGLAEIEDLIHQQKLTVEREKIKLQARQAIRSQRLQKLDESEIAELRKIKLPPTEKQVSERESKIDKVIRTLVNLGVSRENAERIAKGYKITEETS